MNKGLVIRLIAGEYKIYDLESKTIIKAKPRGVMRIKSSAPKVGDYVDYTVIDDTPHTIHCISMTHLFCNWRFVPINPLHFFLSFSY